MMVKKSQFQHDELPDCHTHMRLLKINEDAGDGSYISCELTTWPLHAAPAYDAISYTWGNPEDTTNIFLNTFNFSVRKNCWTVLQQVRALRKNGYVWIDAICINQANLVEKSAQVSIFKNIYQRAESVYACVGLHERDSNFLCEYITNHQPLLAKTSKGLHQMSSNKDWTARTPTLVGTRNILRCFLSADAKTRQRLTHAFIAFLQRPYFSRVWVLQELFLGRSIWICCGDDVIDFNQLFALRIIVEIWTASRHVFWGWFPHPLMKFTLGDAVKYIVRQSLVLRRVGSCLQFDRTMSVLEPQLGVLTLGSLDSLKKDGRSMDLPKVLYGMRRFDCQDSRDRLYGVLSILGSDAHPWRNPIQTDYSKTTVDLVTELVLMLYDSESQIRQPLPLHSPLGLANALLFNVFQCSPEDAFLGLERMTHPQYPPKPFIAADTTWYGMELGPQPDIQISNFPDWAPFLADTHSTDSPPTLVTQNGTILGFAPDSTRAGDWLLMENTEGAWLILRPSSTGKHRILGLVSQKRWHSMGWGLPKLRIPSLPLRFEIWWDVRDLLMLAWKLRIYRDMYQGILEQGAWETRGSCKGFKSFASGPLSNFEYEDGADGARVLLPRMEHANIYLHLESSDKAAE